MNNQTIDKVMKQILALPEGDKQAMLRRMRKGEKADSLYKAFNIDSTEVSLINEDAKAKRWSKPINWVSTLGEVEMIPQAVLMKKYGITHKDGFKRPYGAQDARGICWKSEEELTKNPFKKTKLYLSEVKFKNAAGETSYEHITEEASRYIRALHIVAGDTLPRIGETVKEAKEIIAWTEAVYKIVDNRFYSWQKVEDDETHFNYLMKELRKIDIEAIIKDEQCKVNKIKEL